MKIEAVIVDDEERGVVALEKVLETFCTGVTVTGKAFNIDDAEKIIKKQKPDIVFLDIEMPGGDGFKLLERFDEINFNVVFVTAYHEYAIKAIKFAAFDYLLKPVNIDDVQAVIDKMLAFLLSGKKVVYKIQANQFEEPNFFNKLVLSTMQGYHPVKLNDIIYCKADNTYTHVYMQDGKHHVVSKHLKEFEDMLSPHNFFRIHKTFLINMEHIKFVTKLEPSTVIMSNDNELPISSRKKQEFIDKMKMFD